MEPITIEGILSILNKVGIKAEMVDHDKYDFSRTIKFKVYDVTYKVVWFVNQSTLYIGEGKRAACIPFKYIYLDDCFPLVGGNKSLGFSYVKFEKETMFSREYPYEVFRIPLEIDNN